MRSVSRYNMRIRSNFLADLRSGGAVVAFANDWGTDPTSKHHLMRLLAERQDVLWVEASGMRRPTATSAADLRRIVTKLRKMGGGTRSGAPGMTVLSPPSVPFPTHPAAQRLNALLYRRAIRDALGAMGHHDAPLLWVYTPTAARYLDRIPARGLVYHCVDRWWAFDEYDTAEMRACHEILCRRADHVFVSSLELQRDCVGLTDRVSYVPHGVEWEHFRRAVDDALPRPAGIPDDGRPVIGFVGMIDAWVDLDILAQLARQHPDAHVVVVGHARVPIDRLEGIPNLHLLGRKPFAELPAYLATFDVALIPFMVNDLTRAVNPIKLREYLSAGVPVVTTALPELEPFRGREGVDVVDDISEFLKAVAARVAAPADEAMRIRLSDNMRTESWPGRLETMVQQLNGLI